MQLPILHFVQILEILQVYVCICTIVNCDHSCLKNCPKITVILTWVLFGKSFEALLYFICVIFMCVERDKNLIHFSSPPMGTELLWIIQLWTESVQFVSESFSLICETHSHLDQSWKRTDSKEQFVHRMTWNDLSRQEWFTFQ